MPSLFFPNPDAVRLAVAAGVIPAEVAARPVVAGADAGGGVWVRPPEEVVGSPQLARLNVRLLTPPPELPFAEHPCWAALVPLRPDRTPPPASPLLFDLPAGQLAKFAALVRRVNPQPIRFLLHDGRAILRLDAPPHFLTLTATDTGIGVYRPAARGAWVRLGWEHPLPGPAGFDPVRVALVDPPNAWRTLPEVPFTGMAEAVTLLAAPLPAQPPSVRATIRVPLKVRPARTRSEIETLWLLPGGRAALAAFVAGADDRLIQALQVAEVEADGRARVILRPADRRSRTPAVPVSAAPYAPLPGRGDVFLPVAVVLSPQPRPEAVAAALELPADHLALLEPDPTGLAVHRVPLKAFRPLRSMVSYTVPEFAEQVTKPPAVLFPLPGFVVATPNLPKQEPEPSTSAPVPSARPPARQPKGGTWVGRLAGLFRTKPADPEKRKKAEPLPDPPDVAVTPLPPRVARDRNEWAARRAAVERQVMDAGVRLDPRSRGDLWAELAGLYAETGQPADAGICWANAIWDRAAAPPEWLDQWARAEAKAAKFGPEKITGETVLAKPPSAAVARVLAALMVRASRLGPGVAFPWGEASALLDRFEAELPARAVWLARLAASGAVGGDPLALARCRDRLFARLSAGGIALDLDAPTFVRFHGTAGGGRFADARDWLHRARGTVHKWLERTDPGAALSPYGMEADFVATAAYADLMFAWGLMKLGDRTQARELETAAARVLTGIDRPDVNPEVHRRLLARFGALARAADTGRPIPAPRDLPLADSLAEYVLEQLPLHSRILDPAGGTNRYHSHDLKGVVGGDGFGARLVELFHTETDPNGPLRELLAEAVASREGSRLPRAVLAGFDLSARLSASTAAELLVRFPAAMNWVPKLALLEDEGKRWAFESRLHGRLMLGATATALRHGLTEPMRGAAVHLATVLGGMDSTVREGLGRVAVPVFRGLRKLGLTAECEAILRRVSQRPHGERADPLAFAVGWAAVGREGVAVRALDEARDRLFVAGIPDVRERTAVAVSYAVALGHVQPRLALGRLEELFQRLDKVTVDGATARYYALRPLELIDAAVTAVVTDEFALGPQVRRWLDDDEFQLRKRIAKQLAEAVG